MPLALSSLALASLHAAAAEVLPPIFVPKPVVESLPLETTARPRSEPASPLRLALTERILADARTVAASPTPAGSISPEGAFVMENFIVKSLAPRRGDVEVAPPRIRFHLVDRVDTRVKPGYSATLLRFFHGQGALNLNVVNGAGQGVDHQLDFTRVELEFSFRW